MLHEWQRGWRRVKVLRDQGHQCNIFFGSLGNNNSSQDVGASTDVPVDVDNGYGEVKPTTKGDIWRSLDFFPGPSGLFAFDGVFIRGQITDACKTCTYDGKLFAIVTDVNGNNTNIEYDGIKSNADFDHLGFDETGLGVAIFSADFFLDSTGIFKSTKQYDISLCLASEN